MGTRRLLAILVVLLALGGGAAAYVLMPGEEGAGRGGDRRARGGLSVPARDAESASDAGGVRDERPADEVRESEPVAAASGVGDRATGPGEPGTVGGSISGDSGVLIVTGTVEPGAAATTVAPGSEAADAVDLGPPEPPHDLWGKEGKTPDQDTTNRLASQQWTPERLEARLRLRGIELPETILTGVSGKLMVHGANTGLVGARVVIHSFVPERNLRNAPVVPFRTEFLTDDKGFFTGNIPLGKTAPEGYPSIVLTVWAGGTIPAAAAQDTLNPVPVALTPGLLAMVARPAVVGAPGETTALGIFWVPEHMTNIMVDLPEGAALAPEVTFTGQADPQRWSAEFRDETLGFFPRIRQARTETTEAGVPRVFFATRMDPWKDNYLIDASVKPWQRAVTRRRGVPEGMTGLVASELDGRTHLHEARFTTLGGEALSGQVVDPGGAGVDGAVVLARAGNRTVSTVADRAGMFTLDGLPTGNPGIEISHEHWCTVFTNAGNIRRRTPAPGVAMKTRRPDFTMAVRNADNGTPVTAVILKLSLTEDRSQRDKDGKWIPVVSAQTLNLGSEEGKYRVTAEHRLTGLVVQCQGYRPATVPLAGLVTTPGMLTDVSLVPVRVMDIAPNSHSLIETSEGGGHWVAATDGTDDMITYWGNLGIEYTVNFDQGLPPALATPVPFDLVLGVRNQGVVDNSYSFRIRVLVDGKEIANPTIFADTVNERTATVRLGTLSGSHVVRLVWTNDRWISNELDANIRIASLRIMEAVE